MSGDAIPADGLSRRELEQVVKALANELGNEPEPTHNWECPDCDAMNELDPSVVELCVEHWTTCEECGRRVAFDLAGKP